MANETDLGEILTNLGQAAFKKDPARKSPRIVLLGGGRCTGKTGLQDSLDSLSNRLIVASDQEPIIYQVSSHVSRNQRVLEAMSLKPTRHHFRRTGTLKRNISREKFCMAYTFSGAIYGIPIPSLEEKANFLAPLENIVITGQEKPISPLYVISTVSPTAYRALIGLFPNAGRVIVTIDSDKEDQLIRRVRKRVRAKFETGRRVGQIEYEKVVAREVEKALYYNSKFLELSDQWADIRIHNHDAIESNSPVRIRRDAEEAAIRAECDRHALNVFEYMQRHVRLFSEEGEKIPKNVIFKEYTLDKARILLGEDLTDLIGSRDVKLDLTQIPNQERVRQILSKLEVDSKEFHQAYTDTPIVINYKKEELIVAFPYFSSVGPGTGPQVELGYAETLFLEFISNYLGPEYIELPDNRGIRYALSDSNDSPGVTLRFYSKPKSLLNPVSNGQKHKSRETNIPENLDTENETNTTPRIYATENHTQ